MMPSKLAGPEVTLSTSSVRPDPARQKATQGNAKKWKRERAAYWKIKHQSTKTEKRNFKKYNGRPRIIGKQSTRATKMQHEENGGAPDTAKYNTGAHRRQSDTEHFERHAAWERLFSKKQWTSYTS